MPQHFMPAKINALKVVNYKQKQRKKKTITEKKKNA